MLTDSLTFRRRCSRVTFHQQQISPTIEVRLIKTGATDSWTRCSRAPFHLTFRRELTGRYYGVAAVNEFAFDEAPALIFQGGGIRSAVKEEVVPNKNRCITRWKQVEGGPSPSAPHAADPGLCF